MRKTFPQLPVIGALLLASTVLNSASAAPVSVDAIKGKKILFVVGDTKKGSENDDPLVKGYLQLRGAEVTYAKSDTDVSAANGKDLVLISSTVNARELRGKYRDVPVPVATWNAYTFADMNMTGKVLHHDFSVVREKPFHNENHASFYAHATSSTNEILAAARLPHGMFNTILFSAGETNPSWGKPALSADVAVTFADDRNQAAVFAYERGALMAGEYAAPARRVGLFMGDNTFSKLSDAQGPTVNDPQEYAWFAGRRVVDAAIRWALTPPEQPVRENAPQQFEELKKLAAAKRVLFVRRLDLPWPENEASDQAHMTWLKSLGVELTVVDQMEPESHAQGKDLVIISASINKYKLGMKYANAAVPVIVLEAKAVDSLHMVSRRRNTDYGVNDHKESLYPPENYVDIARPAHPVAAGFPVGQFKLYKTPGVLAWSRPPAGAQVIATIPNQPEHATLFAYEKGATMANDAVAPARRVLFPMDASRFPDLTEEGLTVYGAVVKWGLSKPQS
ncbi:hypothetical protein ACFFWD_26095 [Bradyrhizobium erythrophlei]|uniref:hypothetical protein n=1 Tax=Bradyrhizobium erythrophlei TaxID=1437360 RepID=UPI0035E5F513